MSKLKPCPFCGKKGEPIFPGGLPIFFDHKKGCWLAPVTSLYSHMFAAWNRRAKEKDNG
jgi:hypothetical protein